MPGFLWTIKLLVNCVVWGLLFSVGRICGDCSKYKFFRCDGRRGAFSFYRKICKLTPILISDNFDKYFTFMLLALCDGTTAQLQICSSERNVPLLPVDWKTISKRMMPANPVYVTNIKAPEFAVKGSPGRKCVQ